MQFLSVRKIRRKKGAQVRTMTDIFRKAQRVHIWVGEEQEDDAKGFDLIKRLIRASETYSTSSHNISIANIPPQDRGPFFGLTNSWADMMYVEASIVAFLKMVGRSYSHGFGACKRLQSPKMPGALWQTIY
jgi:hypothetical protein